MPVLTCMQHPVRKWKSDAKEQQHTEVEHCPLQACMSPSLNVTGGAERVKSDQRTGLVEPNGNSAENADGQKVSNCYRE